MMLITQSTGMHQGALKKIETVTYSNGISTKRIFDQPQDTVPMEVEWVRPDQPLDLYSVIEHREVELYKRYFPVH